MTDVLTKSQRSYCMSRIKGRNTKPEINLRRGLWALGLRYSLRSKLPGKPDMVFARYRAVVFVDGCFWHGCTRHMVKPKTNRSFWLKKIQSNRLRDRRVTRTLKTNDWKVIRVWEHELKENAEVTVFRTYKKIVSG